MDIDVVIFSLKQIGIIFKLLDIDNRNFPFAGQVVNRLPQPETFEQFFFGVYGVYDHSSDGKFPLGLVHQVNAVNNEIEFGNDPFLLEIIGHEMDIVIGKSGFAAPLRMPDNAFPYAAFNFPLYCLCGKQLRVAHDVLLDPLGFAHVGNAVLQQHRQTIFAKQRCQQPVCGGTRLFVGNEFRRVFYCGKIVVLQYKVFNYIIFRLKQDG